MTNPILHVLIVESGLPADARMQHRLNGSRLQQLVVKAVDDAESLLRQRHVDAVVVGHRDLPQTAQLRAGADDLPILMVVDHGFPCSASSAIEAGADDVLMASDLKGGGLRRRIELAIARRKAERQRLHAAREDRLTGLANGMLLEERFNRAIARADRFATLVGLVAIKLDNFEQLISDYGRSLADGLLSTIGQRLLGETRQTDTLARTRDHGFTWLVEGLPAIDDISALVNRLPDQLALPFTLGGDSIRVTASVGVAICPIHGRDFQSAHGMAEAAMMDVATISGDSLLMLPIPAARPAVFT